MFWSGCTGGAEGGREGLLLFTWSLQRMSLIHTCSSVVPGRVRCRQNKSVLLFVVRVILVSYEAQVFKHHGRINLPGDPRGRNYLWAPQITSESNIKLLCVCSCLCCHSSTTLVGLHRSFNRPYSHLLPAMSVSECRRQICASMLFVFFCIKVCLQVSGRTAAHVKKLHKAFCGLRLNTMTCHLSQHHFGPKTTC